MILNERQKEHLFMLLSDVAAEYGADANWWIKDAYRLVLDDGIYHAIYMFDPDKHRNLVEKVPKTHRSKVLKAVELLKKNINRTRDLLINNPPDWVKNAVLITFLSRFMKVSVSPILEAHRRELLETVPGDASSYNVKYKGKEFSGLILFPTQKELENLQIEDISSMYEYVFEKLVERVIEFLPEKQSVKLYDYVLYYPRDMYYEVLKAFGQYDTIVEMVKSDMGEVLDELKQIGEVQLSHDSITVKVDPETVERINRKYGLDIESITVHFKYDPSARRGSEGRVIVKTATGTFHISKPYKTCLTRNCENENLEFKFEDYGVLPLITHRMIDRAVEIVAFTKNIEKNFIVAGSKRGYKHTVFNIRYVDAYSDTTEFGLYKKVGDKYSVTVKLHINHNTGRMTSSYSIIVGTRRKVPESVINEFKFRIIVEGVNREFKMEIRRDYWEIKGMNIAVQPDLSNIDTVFSEAEKVAEIASTIYEEYVVDMKRKRETIKLTPEHYMAIYLTNTTISAHIPVEETTGRPKIVLYSVVSRIASKHNVPGSPAKDSSEIIMGLFDAGYIKVDNNLSVYIGGKRYVSLLKALGGSILPTQALSWEKSIAVRLISAYLYRRVGGSYKTGYIKALYEKGLFSDNVIYELLSQGAVYIPPEDMAQTIEGKPAWSHLSPATKKLYIEKLYLPDKVEIYFNPALSSIFRDVVKDVERELIESGNTSILTRIAVESKPRSIGLNNKADVRIVRSGDFYGIDAGAFIVQVMSLTGQEKEFVVYRKDTKIGFVFKAKSIGEAVAEASLRYDRIFRIYKRIEEEYKRNMKVGDGFVLMYTQEGEYRIPYLMKGDKIHYIGEHTVLILKRKEQQSMVAEEVM